MIKMDREMPFLKHLDELRRRLLRIAAVVVAVTLFSFLFGIERFRFGSLSLWLPYPDPINDIAALCMKKVEGDMLPSHVKLIVTSPTQAIMAQLYVSTFLGILLGVPVIVHQLAAFIGPALYPNEVRSVRRLLLPSLLLFFTGAAFTYLYISPIALQFLYSYGLALGAETFITVDELINFVFFFTLAGGLSFQLPIAMWAVTVAELVDVEFWRRNLSYAIVAIAIFGAMITPDGSGITMWLISGPMIGLYLAAYLILRRRV